MEATSIAQRMGLTNAAAVAKAREYERLLAAKAPRGLGACDVCRGAACLSLGCRAANAPFDSAKACAACCATQTQFLGAMSAALRLLALAAEDGSQHRQQQQQQLTVRDACRRVGRPLLVTEAETVLAGFKARFLARLPERQRAQTDLSGPAFVGAAVCVVGARRHAKLARSQVAAALDVSVAELGRAVRAMDELLGPSKAPAAPAGEKRKRVEKSKDEEDEEQDQQSSEGSGLDAFACVRKQLGEKLGPEPKKRQKKKSAVGLVDVEEKACDAVDDE